MAELYKGRDYYESNVFIDIELIIPSFPSRHVKHGHFIMFAYFLSTLHKVHYFNVLNSTPDVQISNINVFPTNYYNDIK